MHNVRKLLSFVKPYWKMSLAALVLLTALVFLDLTIPRLVQRIIDQGINAQNMSVVISTSVLMLTITLISAALAVGNNLLSVRVGESLARDLREALFLQLQKFSYSNLDTFTTGKLMVRLSSDTSAVQRLVQVSLRIGTRAPLLMIGSLILMVVTDWKLALTISPVLLVTSIVIVFFIRKMEPLFRSVQQKLDRMNTVLQENIAGARVVKSFVRADFEGQRFETASEAFTAHTVKVVQFMSAMSPALTIFVNIGMVIVIYSGGLQHMDGDLSLGQIVAFTNYLLTTMTPLTMMTLLSQTWAQGFTSWQRVDEILSTTPAVEDRPGARLLPDPLHGRVVFEDVSFHYNGSGGHDDPADRTVLDGINLVAEPGQTVAILGATGSGKSTLVNLVPRFYDVTRGCITIDGIDIRDVKQDSLRAQIGVVPQETVLFSGTVRENIRYGRPQASEEEVIAAAQAAQAHDFILRLPQGYDTHVEERGVNLSGGQKQRIAIARALLLNPRILILDDSTSSVDVETETKIQDALAVLMQGRTAFVVAQRISTVLKADKIVLIDRGKVVAEGSHADLIRTSKIYQEIYDSQLGDGFQEDQA